MIKIVHKLNRANCPLNRCRWMLIHVTTSSCLLMVATPLLAKTYPVTLESERFTPNDGQAVQIDSAKLWDKFLSQPLMIRGENAKYRIVLTKNPTKSEPRFVVDNCRALFTADNKGYVHITSSQPGPLGWNDYRSAFASTCYIGLIASRMRSSKQSFVHNFKLTPSNIHKFSLTLYPAVTIDDQQEADDAAKSGKRLGQWPIGTKTKKFEDDGVEVDYSYGSYQRLFILARGDFNHDGIQDLLVLSNFDIGDGGHLSTSVIFVVTRTTEDGNFSVLKNVPFDSGSHSTRILISQPGDRLAGRCPKEGKSPFTINRLTSCHLRADSVTSPQYPTPRTADQSRLDF